MAGTDWRQAVISSGNLPHGGILLPLNGATFALRVSARHDRAAAGPERDGFCKMPGGPFRVGESAVRQAGRIVRGIRACRNEVNSRRFRPFHCGGVWLRHRVRFGRVDVGQSWMWRAGSCGTVAGAVEFADADQMPLHALPALLGRRVVAPSPLRAGSNPATTGCRFDGS